MKKIRVGILGGSFDPPHSGHLLISDLAIKKLGLSQIWWIPTLQNPLKSTSIRSSFSARIKLCEELTKNNPKIKVKDLEQRFFRSAKKFYTYNLLKRLNAKFKDHEFYFIIGADSLAGLHKWHRFKELPKLADIVVFNRPGFKQKALKSKAASHNIHKRFIQDKAIDISSTQMRSKKS
jgi:nicotinate-nucleotide adenylyltransferase